MFVYVCDACLDGNHNECEKSTWERDGVEQVGYGGGRCVCSHGAISSTFEEEVRHLSEVSRRHRSR
jgi:hypothetical protein